MSEDSSFQKKLQELINKKKIKDSTKEPTKENHVKRALSKHREKSKKTEASEIEDYESEEEYDEVHSSLPQRKVKNKSNLDKKDAINSGEFETDSGIVGVDRISSYDFMPAKFLHFSTDKFGVSNNMEKNPYLELKEVALSSNYDMSDRIQATRYMSKIPVYKIENHIVEAIISILKEESYPIDERYKFFTTQDKSLWFKEIVTYPCHEFFFNNMYPPKTPIIYRILSAQFLIQNQSTLFEHWLTNAKNAEKYLIDIAEDKTMSVNFRAECSDILMRLATMEGRIIGRNVINELGDLYLKNKARTVYTNAENVHTTEIEESVIKTIEYLSKNIVSTNKSLDDIREKILFYTRDYKGTEGDKRKKHIESAFNRIVIDTAKYVGLTTAEILMLVFEKMNISPSKVELEKRLVQELEEMDQTCSSGHVSRIVNILSGFVEEVQPVTISIKDQIRGNVFGRLNAYLRQLPMEQQNEILAEMTGSEKDLLTEFVISYSPYQEMYKEFVGSFISKEEFEITFNKAIKDYTGE